jgi:hypothetical protein
LGFMGVGLGCCGHWFFLSGFVLAVRLAEWARWHGAGDVGVPGRCRGSVPGGRLGRVFRPVFDGPGGGSAFDGRGLSGETAGAARWRAHQEPAKRLKAPLSGRSGHAGQTQCALIIPGAIAGFVQLRGHWLVRSSQPCTLECSPRGVNVGPLELRRGRKAKKSSCAR